MAQILDMPQLSDTMKEGVLRKWRKNEGDKVAPGELLAEVETDKATMDFEAFDEGVLLKRLIGDGETVPVGSPIAIIGKAGEDIGPLVEEAKARAGGKSKGAAAAPAPAPKPQAAAPAAPKPQPKAEPASKTATTGLNGNGAAPLRSPAPSPARPAASSTARGTGGGAAGTAQAESGGGKVLASPLARRLATDLGIDLRRIKGSGPGGRIVERDVKGASDSGQEAGEGDAGAEQGGGDTETQGARTQENRPGGAGGGPAAPVPLHVVPDRRTEARPGSAPAPSTDLEKPLSMMRRTIARRLLESKTTVPHFYLTADADMDACMEFREQVSQVHGAKLSVNDLIIKAVALGLRRVPEANASFTDTAILQHARIDIGMAVAIEDGLVTPVIRDADKKTLGQIANEAKELAARARDRKLRPEEMTGGTFSVSNLGMFGIKDFSAIINPPEGAILAVGTVRKEPVVKDNQVVVGQRISLTLSCDHRVIDGALGAKLMQAIVATLERPMTLAF
jgi:pyruvate dehydrogenase E2 component (dihydrolipoamide acetyltransferase)